MKCYCMLALLVHLVLTPHRIYSLTWLVLPGLPTGGDGAQSGGGRCHPARDTIETKVQKSRLLRLLTARLAAQVSGCESTRALLQCMGTLTQKYNGTLGALHLKYRNFTATLLMMMKSTNCSCLSMMMSKCSFLIS